MALWKTHDHRERKRSVVVRGCWVGVPDVYKEMAQGNLRGDGMPLYETVGLDIPFYAFVKDCPRVSSMP